VYATGDFGRWLFERYNETTAGCGESSVDFLGAGSLAHGAAKF